MILYIRICNFKSFKGVYCFRPIKDLTTVLGRSLSGKTNFAEALGFLVGLNYKQLRCTSYDDLIHGHGNTVTSAYVEAKLQTTESDFEQVTIQRRVDLHHERTTYMINNQEVTEEVYHVEIEKLGFSPLCLVLENKMDYFVRMSPVERTSFIEQICGSKEMKDQYDDAVFRREVLHADLGNLSHVLTILQLKYKEIRNAAVEDEGRELGALDYHKKKLQEMKLLQTEKNIINKRKTMEKIAYEIYSKDSAKEEKEAGIEDLISRNNEILEYTEILQSIKNWLNEVIENQDLVLSYNISFTYFSRRREELNKEEDCLKKRNKIEKLMHNLSRLKSQIKRQDYTNDYDDNQISEYVEQLMNISFQVENQRAELEQEIMNLHWCQEELEDIKEEIEYWENELDLSVIQEFQKNTDKELQMAHQQYENLQSNIIADEDKQKICELNEKIYNCSKNFMNKVKRERKKRVLQHLQAAYGKIKIDHLSELWAPIEEKYKKVIDIALGEQRDMIIVETAAILKHVKQTMKEMEAYEELVALDIIQPRQTRVPLRIGLYNVTPIRYLMIIKEEYNPAVLKAVSNTCLCEELALKWKDLRNVKEKVILMDGAFYENPHIMSYTNMDLQNESLSPEEESSENAEKEKVEVLHKLNELIMKIHLKSRLQSLEGKINYLEQKREKLLYTICDMQRDNETEQKKQAERKQELEKEVTYNSRREELRLALEEKLKTVLGGSYVMRKKCKWDFRKYHELLKRKQRILAEHEIELRKTQLMESILEAHKRQVDEHLNNMQEPVAEMMFEKNRDKDLEHLITTSDNARKYIRDLNKSKFELKEIEDELWIKHVTSTAAEGQLECLKIKLQNLLVESFIKGIEVKTRVEVDIVSLFSTVLPKEVHRYVVSYTNIQEKDDFDLDLEASKVNRLEEKIASNRLKRENGGELRLKKYIQDNTNKTNDLQKQIHSLNGEIKQLHEKRKKKFMNCFQFLEKHVDKFYKELYRSQDCFASLTLENKAEPYLGGVNYNVKVPGKACVAMDCLTSQETNLASCIAIIALNIYRRTPFLFIDKPDAILDPDTGSMFAKFLNKKKHGHTFVSPKRCMESLLPDGCIGFTRKVVDNISCTTMFVLDVSKMDS